eukprot:7083657-Pyramimonas_sp.AAC.1
MTRARKTNERVSALDSRSHHQPPHATDFQRRQNGPPSPRHREGGSSSKHGSSLIHDRPMGRLPVKGLRAVRRMPRGDF